MAYNDGDYLFTVRGTMAGSEEFSNTWACKSVDQGTNLTAVVDALNTFYDTLATGATPIWNDETVISSLRAQDLFVGEDVPVVWNSITGNSNTVLMPTECSLRISLSGGGRHRGGPFLPPMRSASLDKDGRVLTGYQSAVADALVGLLNDVDAAGAQVALHAPSLTAVVDLTSAKVGRVFDAIRRRRNELPEDYLAVAIP